jgi:hypothetical protein
MDRHSGRAYEVGEIRNPLSKAAKQQQIPGSSPMKLAMPGNDDEDFSETAH